MADFPRNSKIVNILLTDGGLVEYVCEKGHFSLFLPKIRSFANELTIAHQEFLSGKEVKLFCNACLENWPPNSQQDLPVTLSSQDYEKIHEVRSKEYFVEDTEEVVGTTFYPREKVWVDL